jgi:polyisoprenoid-binding protein YceI
MHPSRYPAVLRSLALVAIALSPARQMAQTPSRLLAQSYAVDPQHSTIEFVSRILGAVKVRGRFTDYAATIVYDSAAPERSSVSAIIKVASLTTDMSFRDRHLKSPDFFDVQRFPTIAFESDRVDRSADGLVMHGTLTLHGVSRPITMPIHVVLPPEVTPNTGQAGTAFEAQLRINRQDFGIAGTNKFNPDYDPATTILSDSVDVILELRAQRDGFLNRRFTGQTPPSIADTVGKVLVANGVESAVKVYKALRATQPSAYNFKSWQLDALARWTLAQGRPRDALALFKLNAEIFPASSGVAQGVAEGYAQLDDREHALLAYGRALRLDSTNTDAREMIRRLKP